MIVVMPHVAKKPVDKLKKLKKAWAGTSEKTKNKQDRAFAKKGKKARNYKFSYQHFFC